MNYSNTDIKPKKVMYVNFEPIKPNEFGGKHLAVILKNNGDKTAIVVPLTSIGPRDNKIQISLPTHIPDFPALLKVENTYATLDNIRTVQFQGKNPGDGRFTDVMSDVWKPLYIEISDNDFNRIVDGCMTHLEQNVKENFRLKTHLDRVQIILSERVINIAYSIKKASEDTDIKEMQNEIRNYIHMTIDYKPYLKKIDFENSIDTIINDAVNQNIVQMVDEPDEIESIEVDA